MKITYNTKNINMINEMARLALLDTAEAVKTDLIQSQTMPFDTGTMQNDSTFVDDSEKGKVSIVSSTPYARRLYFHPEYNFRRGNNSRAGGKWFDSFLNDNFISNAYAKLLKRIGGL